MPDLRLRQRYARRIGSGEPGLDRLAEVVRALHRSGSGGDPFFLARALELLVSHLEGAQATLVLFNGGLPETRWWHPERETEAPPPVGSFCAWLKAHPDRILVVKDMDQGPHVPALEGEGVVHRAALGCALRQGEEVVALLFVYFGAPRRFTLADHALLEAVAGFVGRALEVEDLRQSLHRLEDALALTKAVMEDHATRDTETGLPNLRYLEIWEQALLQAPNRPDHLVVAAFDFQGKGKPGASRARQAMEGLRAGDLLVRTSPGRCLAIFQRTPRSLAHILLLRIRSQLGTGAMGATHWVPGPEGHRLESCFDRLEQALGASRAQAPPVLVWNLPEGAEVEAEGRPASHPAAKGPRPWQPMVLQAPAIRPPGRCADRDAPPPSPLTEPG